VIQGFYKRTPLMANSTIVDELLGGVLGILQAVLILGCVIVILDSYFHLPSAPTDPHEIPFLREFFKAYDNSAFGDVYRTTLIPAFLAVVGFFVPEDVRRLFAGRGT
jgi:hypothetical protein